MAIRLLHPPNFLRNFRHLARPINSSSAATATPETEPTTTPIPSQTLDLHDHRKIFASLSTFKLLRSAVNLNLAAMGPVVDFGTWIMNSGIVETGVLRNVVLRIVKHTFFEHFCAGETEEETVECVRRIREAGLRAMLVYGLEHTTDNAGCDRNLQGFLRTVQLAKSLPSSSSFRFFRLKVWRALYVCLDCIIHDSTVFESVSTSYFLDSDLQIDGDASEIEAISDAVHDDSGVAKLKSDLKSKKLRNPARRKFRHLHQSGQGEAFTILKETKEETRWLSFRFRMVCLALSEV